MGSAGLHLKGFGDCPRAGALMDPSCFCCCWEKMCLSALECHQSKILPLCLPLRSSFTAAITEITQSAKEGQAISFKKASPYNYL